MTIQESSCPGCGLTMPVRSSASYEGYFNISPECWQVFTEVLASEYSNAVLFGRIHQLTVDAYAVQHAGGRHPDKSVGIHFAGLYLMLVKEVNPIDVPMLHQKLAVSVKQWPHFKPPPQNADLSVFDIALPTNPRIMPDSYAIGPMRFGTRGLLITLKLPGS